MISSVFTLKESNDIHYDLINTSKETVLEQNYYTNSSYKFLLETHEELLSCRQDFYRTVLEAENDYVINESFNDVINKVKEIIKKILAYIESLIKRFVTQLNKFIGSEKYLMKRKDDIRKFSNDDSFDITGYEYTLDPTIPAVDTIGLDLNELKDELRSINNKDINAQIDNINNIITKFTDENRLEEICGDILKLDKRIPETSFDNEAFAVYRDGQSSESDITIERKQVIDALDRYTNYKDTIKSVQSLEKNIKVKYKTLESQIESIIKENITLDGDDKLNTSVSSIRSHNAGKENLKNSVSRLINSLVSQVQKISTLHTRAIAIKLDAYNSSVLQDKNILYRALNAVQKDIRNMKSMKEEVDLSISMPVYDYTRAMSSRSYMIELYAMNTRQQKFVEECLALSESNIPELKSINEDLKMNVKGKFQKLIDFVKQLFEKFLMKINEIAANDEKFLTKYKDIILNKRIDKYTLNDMPNYKEGIKNIKETKIAHIDFKQLEGKSEDGVQKEVLTAFDGSKDFTEFANGFFLNGNTAVKDVTMMDPSGKDEYTMGEIYNFCAGYKETLKLIQADRDKFTAEANNIIKVVSSTAGTAPKIPDTAKKEAPASNTSKETDTIEAVDIFGRKYHYSTVLEAYICEDDAKQTSSTNSGTANGTAKETGKDNAKPNVDLNIKNKESDKTNSDLKDNVQDKDKARDAETQADENKSAEKKKIEQTGTWYLDALKITFGAKLNAFTKIYKEYMNILRHHVRQATGSLGTASKFSSDEVEKITKAMKDYLDAKEAKDDDKLKTAREEIRSLYRAKDMKIDDQDIDNLVSKNASKLKGK